MKLSIKRFIWSYISICLAVLVCHSSTAFSAVPEVINYQGSLSDAGGNPVNATFNITFTLYDVDAGPGTTLWQETQSVTVTNGQFSVQLGADGGNPLPALLDDPLFLGVQVDADAEMTPRQKFTSTAFALRAKTVENDTLNSLSCAEGEIPKLTAGIWACGKDLDKTYSAGSGLTLSGTTFSIPLNGINASHLAPNSVGSSEVQDNSITGTDIANNTITGNNITSNSISGIDIVNDSITSDDIATGAIGTNEVQDNSLTANDLAFDSVGASEIATGAVASNEVLDNSLNSIDMSNEPGVEFLNDAGFGTDLSVTTTWAVMRNLLVTAPSTGFVTCIAAGAVDWEIENLTVNMNVGWDTTGGTTEPASFNLVRADSGTNFDQRLSITAMHTFNVTAGTTTFSLKAQCVGCLANQMDYNFHSAACMFFPTRY